MTSDEVVAPVRRSAWWRRVSGRMDKASSVFSAEMQGLAVRPAMVANIAGHGQYLGIERIGFVMRDKAQVQGDDICAVN